MDEKARAGPGRESDYATDSVFLKNANYWSAFRIFEKRSAESRFPCELSVWHQSCFLKKAKGKS